MGWPVWIALTVPQDGVAARLPVTGNENAAPAIVPTNAPAKTTAKNRAKSTSNDTSPAATATSRPCTSAANDDNAAAVMTMRPSNNSKKRARSNKAGDALVPQPVAKHSKKSKNKAATSGGATSGGAHGDGARSAGGAVGQVVQL